MDTSKVQPQATFPPLYRPHKVRKRVMRIESTVTRYSGDVSKAYRKRMHESIADFKNYVLTYGENEDIDSYPQSVVVDDMIYCLGVALFPEDKYRQGYDKFRLLLIEFLQTRSAPKLPDVVFEARRVCLACNQSLDTNNDYGNHESNDPCVLHWVGCGPDPVDWCSGCRSVATVKIVLKDTRQPQEYVNPMGEGRKR